MEKAILFEPALLAEVERESPDLYKYYCSCPISKMEFVDYGIPKYQFFIRKEIMDGIELIIEHASINLTRIIAALQMGYSNGMVDLIIRLPEDPATRIEDRELLLEVFDLVLNYSYWEIESLFDENNYAKSNGLLYNKMTYREAQYYIAWKTTFSHHKDFNAMFRKINVDRKKYVLDVKKMLDEGFSHN